MSEEFLGQTGKVADMTHIQDVMAENRLWNIAGYGFGEQEAYFLQQSMKKLAVKEDLKSLRFWGKFFCTKNDYFVCEAVSRKVVQDPVPDDWEPAGVGINQQSFWVTNDLMETWVELPVIGPQHQLITKKTRASLTGDLNANVNVYPPFPGKEKHYLKAQLARITFGSKQVPGGIYEVDGDNPTQIKTSEEINFPAKDVFYDIGGWVHHMPAILEYNGRVSHFIPKGLDEDAANQKKEDLDAVETPVDRLRPLSDEKFDEAIGSNYLARVYGDKTSFNVTDPSEGEGPLTNSIFVITSQLWPGWYIFASSRHSRWSSQYLGSGAKAGQVKIPNQPSDVKPDPDDLNEMPEPNHKEDPKPEPGEEDGEGGEGDGEGGDGADE